MAKKGTIGSYTRGKLDSIIELKLGGLDDIPISAVTAGDGLSGGGTSGTVTMTVDVSDSDLTTATAVQTGDLVLFSDESAANDPTQNITVDNLITKAPALLTEASVANGDYIVFLDGGATSDTKKEAVHDLATLFSGNGLAAASSVIGVDINGATDGTGITVASGDMVLLADADDSNAVKKVNVSQLPSSGMTSFQLEDGDGTEVAVSDGKEVKFVEGTGIDINWTDVDNGTDGDPYDLTFTVDLEGTELVSTGESGGSKFLREDGDGTCSWQTVTVDIDALSALGGTGVHQTQDHFIFSDNGTEKKITFSNLEDAIFANVSGDGTIAAGGALTIADDVVSSAELADACSAVTSFTAPLVKGSTSVQTPLIEYTDGDDSMTIADGGKVTFAAGFAVGSDAAGDVLYHNGTSYVRLAKGSDDEVLTLASGVPSWAAAGGSMSFVLEDDDGTEISVSNGEEVKIIGSGVTTNWTDTTPGSDADPFDLTITVDAAQTGITSILATDIKIGEDDQTKIDFETEDEIHFYAANVHQVKLVDNAFTPQADSDVDLGAAGTYWKDAFIDTVTTTGDIDCLGNIELGHVSDTTLARASSGDVNIEGNIIYRAGGTDVPVADGGTGASSLTDGGVLLGSGAGAITAMAALADGEMIVGDGTTDPVAESGATLRTSIGVGTGDSPQFTAIELGAASDTTIARSGAGAITVEGTAVLLAGAQTGITTILNTGTKVGRDAHNLIDFTTDDTITFRVANVNEIAMVANVLQPVTNDGVALGTTSLGWSDLHLATGGVINWANGEMTITEGDANTLTVAGGTFATAALTTSTIVASGVVKTDDTTDATSTTDGSLQTDGGLSVAKDIIAGNDVYLLSDSAVLGLGAGNDFTITHDGTTGATIAGTPISIDSTGELHLNSTTGDIKFQDQGDDQLALDLDGTGGEIIMKLMVDSDDFVFQQYDGTEVFRVEDNGDFDIAGGLGSTGVTVSAAGVISADGRIITDDTTDATSTTDGSIQTDGGLSIAKDVIVGNDLSLKSDSSVVKFGENEEITLTHEHNVGLILTHTATVDNTAVRLTLKSEEDDIAATEVIAAIDFKGGDSGGTDAILVCAGIEAVATDTHAADNNATKLSFKTAASEAAAEKMSLSSTGVLTLNGASGALVIPDAGTIGSASDTDAIAISSGGAITLSSIAACGSDVDKFLVSNSGVVQFRTGAEVASDIGAVATGTANTFTADQTIAGDTPKLTIGDGDAEDSMLAFDGNEVDFHIALDDNVNDLVIGTGTAAGTATAIMVDGGGTLDTTFYGHVKLVDDKAIYLGTNDDYVILYDETTHDTINIGANVADADFKMKLYADANEAAGDAWLLTIADGGTLTLGNDKNSHATYVTHLTVTPNATVTDSTVSFAGNVSVATACSPDASDGATLGTAALEWSDLYLATSGSIQLGADQDVVLTHVHDVGLTLEVGTASGAPVFEIKNKNNDATSGILKFNKDGASAADDDVLGEITFVGENAAGSPETITYAYIRGLSEDVTDEEEDGSIILNAMVAGTARDIVTIGNGAGVVLPNDSTYGTVKANAFITYSDETLKHDIITLENSLDKIMAMRGVSYTWNSDNTDDIGFIGQEIQEIVPEVVYKTKNQKTLGIDYASMTALLVEAVKEQQNQITDLKAIIDTLKKTN